MISTPAVLELIDKTEKYSGPLHDMRNDTTIKRHIEILQTLLRN